MLKPKHVVGNVGEYSRVKSIEECEPEDVYCLSVPETGCFVANGMVVKNCDALRYVVYTHKVAKTHEPLHNPDEYRGNRFEPTRRF